MPLLFALLASAAAAPSFCTLKVVLFDCTRGDEKCPQNGHALVMNVASVSEAGMPESFSLDEEYTIFELGWDEERGGFDAHVGASPTRHRRAYLHRQPHHRIRAAADVCAGSRVGLMGS